MESPGTTILSLLGRLHTVALHLPIGFLVLAFLLEISSRFVRFQVLKPAIPFVLFWSMIAAIITALLGYFLSLESGYDAAVLWNHKILGIATAGLATLLYLFRNSKTIYTGLLGVSMVVLLFAGHTGGSITHGDDFLFEPLQTKIVSNNFVGKIDDIPVYEQIIRPILKAKCISCHNPAKIKGGLLLTDTIGIKKGGDTGPFFVAHQADESAMIQRIQLPQEDKEHMPPKGKQQLSGEEMDLLRWWVSGSAEFTKQVKAYPQEASIKAILTTKFVKRTTGREALNIAPVSENQLRTIQSQGLKVFPKGEETPWLEARLSNRKKLAAGDFKALKKVAKNITILDLGQTPMDDDLAKNINAFPNLSKLFLDQTQLTDRGLQKIKPLPYLEYLNLYSCSISDESISHLKQFKNLQALYLWQTNISEQGIAQLKQAFPKIKIINGTEHQNTFADARLKTPKINADSILFSQNLEVRLKLNFPWAKVYYTTDGSTPDTNSVLYNAPFKIDQSTVVKTIATAKNWLPSEIGEATFIAIKKRPASIQLSSKPNPSYEGKGAISLIDFQLGRTDFKDGQWLGWQGEDLNAVIDFETSTTCSGVFVSCLDNNSSWIFFPSQIQVWASDDNRNFQLLADQSFPSPTEQQIPSIKKRKLSFPEIETRFLKIVVKNIGTNPAWHPAAGKPSWLFVDELIVE